MSNSTSNGQRGVTFFDLLGILFIGLKLGGFINWPWLWVLSPFWIPLAILIAILAIVAILKIAFFSDQDR